MDEITDIKQRDRKLKRVHDRMLIFGFNLIVLYVWLVNDLADLVKVSGELGSGESEWLWILILCFASSLLWHMVGWSLIAPLASRGTKVFKISILLAFFAPAFLFMLSILALKWMTDSEYVRLVSNALWNAFYGGFLLGIAVKTFRIYWHERRLFEAWEASLIT